MPTIREITEAHETRTLHHRACASATSRGRERPEGEDDLRTCFQRDRDRIVHCKAFRRLKHKTQVFLAPKGDHYRTRLTHALEVSQIARTIGRALRLNEDLIEAIALAHDLGHTPFGHAGESVLREIHPGGFDHYEQSLRVVDRLEKGGRGLNLTFEVRDGVVKHSKGRGLLQAASVADRPVTLEGMVVRAADIIAYVSHDLDDALRAGIIRKGDVPREILRGIGDTYSERIGAMVRDVVGSTIASGHASVSMSGDMSSLVYRLRDFLFERVYESARIMAEFRKAQGILRALYTYSVEHPEEARGDIDSHEEADSHGAARDFVAGMTDHYAVMTYERLFLPQQWSIY